MFFKLLAIGLTTVGGLVPATFDGFAGEPNRSEAGCHETAAGYTCFYGPFSVGAEGKEILELVEAPDEAGYITSARATLVDRYNDPVSQHMVHLHHAVWVNPVERDLACSYLPDRFFGSGKERTPMRLPDGYGYWWANEASDHPLAGGRKGWGLNAHLDGMHDMTHRGIYIRLRLGFNPAAEGSLTAIRPFWSDVNGSCTVNPTFDVAKGAGKDNRYEIAHAFYMPVAGRFIGMAGHLHDGGLRLRLRNATDGHRIFRSKALYEDDARRWFLTGMTAFYDDRPRDPRLAVDEGDRVKLTAVYDSSRRREDAMGIMLGALVEED